MSTETNQPISPQNFNLSGKTALVTGASRGIGRALSIGLAQAGARVILAGRSEDQLRRVAAEIGGEFPTPVILELDVTDFDKAPALIEECCLSAGGLDILINNAGFESVADSLDVTPSLWDSIVNTNLKAAFFMAQAAAKMMLGNDDKAGCIVNLCSLSSSVGIPTAVPYTSSKSGLLGMTRALSSEWAPKGIRVNAIAPGEIDTPILSPGTDEIVAKLPLGRIGTPEEVAKVIYFLCKQKVTHPSRALRCVANSLHALRQSEPGEGARNHR